MEMGSRENTANTLGELKTDEVVTCTLHVFYRK